MAEKILLVDDDSNVLNGFRRHLRKSYDITLADGAPRGLSLFDTEGPFAVVVSDMQMPIMNGVFFLKEIAKRNKETIRIMLTGNADQDTAVSAVNESHVFRFLNKPCSPEELAKAIDEALVQYRLVRAERELLSKTLSGSVALLTDLLSLVNSTAFGRAGRNKSLVHEICKQLGIKDAWQIEIAAMLAQIGCVTVPESVLNRYYSGEEISSEEEQMFQNQAKIGHDLVSRIPRLERVAEIILRQNLTQNQWVKRSESERDEFQLPSSILKAVLDFDLAVAQHSPFDALRSLKAAPIGKYDPQVLATLIEVVEAQSEIREIKLQDLKEGMLLAEPVRAVGGELLVNGQNEVTASMLARLKLFASHRKIEEPIRIHCETKSAFQNESHAKSATA